MCAVDRTNSHAGSSAGPDAPSDGRLTWVGLFPASLPVDQASAWVVAPACGAVVTFTGTARDHSDERADVTQLEYEAYEGQVEPRLEAIAAEARRRWAGVGRVALLHRTGALQPGDAAVVVAVATPHRDEAFAAARFCIDRLKATVPIWKRERWRDGDDWGLDATAIESATELHR
jgi:molybdopterin synthase catalytic subunit